MPARRDIPQGHATRESAYLCLEPVTLLPGALQVYHAAQSASMIALAPRCSREITRRRGVVPETSIGPARA